MSFIGNSNGFIDSKNFRKCVLKNANDRLGIIVRTLTEGNGTQTNKTQGLLGMLDSNYKSDVPATKYAMHLKAIAFESARFLCSSNSYNSDLIFLNTRGEYLYQNIGSFLFPGEQIPQTKDTDVIVQSFYLSIIEAYFGGATKANIESALYSFTGIPVVLNENYQLSKVNESLDSVVNQFVFSVNVDTTDPRIKDVNKLKADIKFLLDLIKPAHTTYQTNFIYREEFLSESVLSENYNLDIYDYKYEDLRKKSTNIYSFHINDEIIQRHSPDNIDNIYQASPRIVKTRDLSFLKESDPSFFHTRHGPLGKSDGQLATEVTDIVVYVNGIQVEVSEIYPLSGSFKLPFIPLETDLVSITYYYLRKYVGDLTTNAFDSLLNNVGNGAEYPYQTVLFPSNYSSQSETEVNQLITSYRYKGYDLFNTSVLNDPLNLNYNETGTRNKLNDYHVFKSLGYDQGQYNTSLQEGISLVPMTLDKKDVWRRLPHQELRLNNNEFIMNNIEDRMFGEIHYESYHPFYSALELDTINNGGVQGLVSSIFEDPTSPMILSLVPFNEQPINLGREYDCALYTYSPSGSYPPSQFYIDGCYPKGYYGNLYSASGYYSSGYSPLSYNASVMSVLNGYECVLLNGSHWDFGNQSASGYFGGNYASYHLLLDTLLTETVPSITENWISGASGILWNRDPSENAYFSTLLPVSGYASGYNQSDRGYLFHIGSIPQYTILPSIPDPYTSINALSATSISPIHLDEVNREYYKKDFWFMTNSSLSNTASGYLSGILAATKLTESDIVVHDNYYENTVPFTLNDVDSFVEIYSISSDLNVGWIKFLTPKKISHFANVINYTLGFSFDLTDSYLINNQVIMIKNTVYNASIFSALDSIRADINLFDTMNETDKVMSVFDDTNYVFYSEVDITSVNSLTNYTASPSGEYNLSGYYILGNSLIFLDKNIQTIPLSKGDIVFAEIITKEEEDNPANTLTSARNTRIMKFIEIEPV